MIKLSNLKRNLDGQSSHRCANIFYASVWASVAPLQ